MVDASVLAKWVLPGEPYQGKALRLKEDHILGLVELCAPSFIVQEAANALWRAMKLGRIDGKDAEEALKALGKMKIELHNIRWAEASEGLSLASGLDLTIYDTSYLSLSNKLQAPLITADEKLLEKAKERFRVLHIKDYS